MLSQVLVRRGLGDRTRHRCSSTRTSGTSRPAFAGIERALEPIERQIAAGGRITVHGDYDVDGVCATAIMVRALRALGADVGWYLPGRLEDGYGLAPHTVERLAARGTALLVTVDCAITAVDEVAAARAAGLEVVVTDHHAPRADGRLPDCPIVHPAVCALPVSTGSAATAVAYKLAQALGARDGRRGHSSWSRSRRSPTSCRCVGENRRLVREGLAALANTAKPGLRALIGVAAPIRARSTPGRSASGWRRGSTPPGGCAGPTRASSCC